MTISSTTNTVSYTGNGSTTAFAVPYVFFGTGTTSEIEVVEVVIATGVESVKSNGSDFTVSGGSGTTGTVTAATAPASTVKWVINRTTTQTQETDYVENDPFPAESHEEALDRLTAIGQEQQRALDRTAQLPDGYTGAFDPTLPATITGGAVLAFNTGATAFEVGPTTAAISAAAANAAAAAASETAAGLSETAAAASETAAAASETASGLSETAAAASETASGLSETAAAASEAAAAASETASGLSETAAAASEAAAAASETAAGLSETAAGTSETNAATSETNAADSETAAAASEAAAAASAASITTPIALVEDTSPQLGGTLDANGKMISWSKGANIASASALDISAEDGNYFDVTGTTTINTISSPSVQEAEILLSFGGVLTLTHSANLLLPGEANITTAAGDQGRFQNRGGGVWRCSAYTRADGKAVVGSEGDGSTLKTAQATTSGSTFDFNSLPAAITRLTMTFDRVSLTGENDLLVQIGDSGGLKITGYSAGSGTTSAVTSTSGFPIRISLGSRHFTGTLSLFRADGAHKWVADICGIDVAAAVICVGGGVVTLTGDLDRIRLTKTGANTFDVGAVNIRYWV